MRNRKPPHLTTVISVVEPRTRATGTTQEVTSKTKHGQCLNQSLDLRTNDWCADHTTSDITNHMVPRWCSRTSSGCSFQAEWQVLANCEEHQQILHTPQLPARLGSRKSHQLATSTHPVQSRSPRSTASLGRVRLPHKYTNEVSFAIVSAFCIACCLSSGYTQKAYDFHTIRPLSYQSIFYFADQKRRFSSGHENQEYTLCRTLVAIYRLASCNQKTDATWPASPLQCSRSVKILGQKSCVELLSRAHSQNMSADCWHQLIWLNAIIQPRWHTWKTFHNQSQKPPQHFPTTDNLAKTEFQNLTHNNISETLIRGGKSRNTMPKPGQTRKKQNRNSYHPRAAKCTLSSMLQACRSPKKWCHWQMMLND